MTDQTENQNFMVDCDRGCQLSFTIEELKTEHLLGGIEKSFFTCPYCGYEYVAYYTDPEIRGMQKEIRELQERLAKKYKQKLALRHDKLKRKAAVRMRQLKFKVEAGIN